MKTKRVKVYEFKELSEQAQQKAVNYFIQNDIVSSCEIHDFEKSIKVFSEIVGIKKDVYSNSVLGYTYNLIEDSILSLSGARLAAYIWNNFKFDFWKGKYYSLLSKTDKDDKGQRVYKSRYSKVIKTEDYSLTGFYSDLYLLKPFFDFFNDKENFNATTFQDLLDLSLSNIVEGFEESENHRYSFEAISEIIEANDYNFLKDGTIFNF